jgi:holo-[acyl-carrier protein] synthase
VGDILGVGVDAVDIDRFREVLARRPGLVERMFTDTEREYARRVPDPTQRLAARFAAKEAVLKTLGVGIGAAGLREIEVRRNSEGAPFLALAGAAATLAAKRGITRWHLSLTHTDLVAVASAVAEGGAP